MAHFWFWEGTRNIHKFHNANLFPPPTKFIRRLTRFNINWKNEFKTSSPKYDEHFVMSFRNKLHRLRLMKRRKKSKVWISELNSLCLKCTAQPCTWSTFFVCCEASTRMANGWYKKRTTTKKITKLETQFKKIHHFCFRTMMKHIKFNYQQSHCHLPFTLCACKRVICRTTFKLNSWCQNREWKMAMGIQ